MDIGGQFLAIEQAKKAVARKLYEVEPPQQPRRSIVAPARAALGVALISAGTFLQGRSAPVADEVNVSTGSSVLSGC